MALVKWLGVLSILSMKLTASSAEGTEIDILRDNVIIALRNLREKTEKPEWYAIAKAKGMTPEQLVIDLFPNFQVELSPNLPENIMSDLFLWARVNSRAKLIRGLYSTLVKATEGVKDPDLYSEQWDTIANSAMEPSRDALNYTNRAITEGLIYKQVLREHMDNLCNIEQSPKQLLYNIYDSMQLTQIKAYNLIQFSLLYRKIKQKNEQFDDESRILENFFLRSIERQNEYFVKVLDEATSEYRRCDPPDELDVTYTYLRRFLQGYLQNEVDMNDKQTCREDCGYYKYTKQYSCFEGTYCRKQPSCQGNLVNCRFVDSDMWVCPSESYGGRERRYDWIKYENGRTLGSTERSCRRQINKVDSWWRWLFWHCSYCFCICDEIDSPFTERYFSLKTVMSDVKNNKILTGLKLVKLNKVIYIQGQEAQLMQGGSVNSTDTKWIPIEEVDIHDEDFTDGTDYYTMSWKQRAVDLDDLHAPTDHLVTGVRWKKLGTHLNFEIHVCKFDYLKGELEQGGQKCQWISNDNTDGATTYPRRRLDLNSPDLPTKIRVPSQMMSQNDMYVEVTHTGLDKDVAQTAVPFFDLQPVNPDPPVPLMGAGIHHKRVYGSGGYIALKVFTADPSNITPNHPIAPNK